MDIAWIAPPVVLVAGAATSALLLRRIGQAVVDLAGSQRRFRRMEDALIPVRVEANRARTSIDRIERR
ncbi:hypothetical protein BH23ACT2_BH23ACT2_17980 [soil metagenome]